MFFHHFITSLVDVAPLAGAWIEIYTGDLAEIIPPVAPLAGAWIEIQGVEYAKQFVDCRSPRGSVD